MYIVGIVILVFFAIVGLSAFIAALIGLNRKTDTNGMALMITDIDADNAEMRIRTAAAIAEENRIGRVICLCPEEDEVRMICEKMQKEYKVVEIKSEGDR